jgi:hypothetical protein
MKTNFAIPPHATLKKKTSQSNIRTMSASKHPTPRCKIFTKHLPSGPRRDPRNLCIFVILDEVILPKIDQDRIISD